MKRVLSVLIISLLVMVLIPRVSNGEDPARIPDPAYDPDSGPDVPVWSIGDFWNYTTDITYDLGLISIDLSGWLNMTVVLITLDMFSNGEPVYITNITGNISGEETIPFVGDVKIYIELKGYIWSRCQDLAHYRSVLNASVSGTVSSVNGDYTFGYEYSPPMEEYDFPLAPGDTWRVETTATLPFGTGDLVDINGNYSLGNQRLVSVDAGSFNVYPISIDGIESLFYNETVGNSILRTFTIPAGSTDVDVPFELYEYGRNPGSLEVDLEILDVQQIEAGSDFTLHGDVSFSNVMVNVFFPGGNLASTQALIGSDTDFDAVLTAPLFPDNTPTHMDYGSFGIFVSVNGIQGISVITVTTKARDLELIEGGIRIEPQGEGTIDDVFNGYVDIYNPSNFMVENFSVLIDIDGIPGYPMTIDDLSLEGRESNELSFQIEPEIPGIYNVTVTLDPDDDINEYNETNNVITTNFTVKMRPDIQWNSIPEDKVIEIEEGESIKMFARAVRGGLELPGRWYFEGDAVGVENNFTFFSDFTGPNSSDYSAFQFRYMLDENSTYTGEISNVTYTINVSDINRAPVFIDVQPETGDLTLFEGESINLTIDASDPDGDELEVKWILEGSYQPIDSNWMIFETNFTGYMSSEFSPYGVIASVSDTKGNYTYTSWVIDVIDVDRPFDVSISPDEGNLSLLVNETIELSYNASDPDGTAVTSMWIYLDRTTANETGISINPSSLHLEIGDVFNITLLLGSGSMNRSFNWVITINGTMEPPEPEPEPIKGLRVIEPTGTTFVEGDNITFRAECDDNRTISYSWDIGGVTYEEDIVIINDLEPGNHTVILTANAIDGVSGTANLTFVIRILEKNETEPEVEPDDEEDEDSILFWLIPLLLAAVLIIIVIIAMVIMAGKRSAKDDPWEE